MRYSWLTLASLALIGSEGKAQPPGQTPPQQTPPKTAALDPTHERLDALLLRWEQEMAKIQSVVAETVRSSIDTTFQVAEVYEGTAKYMKPNLAMLEMTQKGKPQQFEKYICTGSFLYEYVPSEKVIRVHEMPPSKPGQVSDDNFLSFLFGMKAEEAKRRYELKLVGEDKWYIYIEI